MAEYLGGILHDKSQYAMLQKVEVILLLGKTVFSQSHSHMELVTLSTQMQGGVHVCVVKLLVHGHLRKSW